MLKSFRRIVDDHYEHALRLLRERQNGVVRLQASVQTGALREKPIWTAFITQQIHAPAWASRDRSRIVHLADLQQFIFTADYNSQKTSTGKIVLTFISSNGNTPNLVNLLSLLIGSDAERFMNEIENLRNDYSMHTDVSDTQSLRTSPNDSEDRIFDHLSNLSSFSEESKPVPPPSPKSILRNPRGRFPVIPITVRDGVAPHKGSSKKEIPPDARWTKIDRNLVSPEALAQDGIMFNEYVDHVIVLKVMDSEEIEKYKRKTAEIREQRRSLGA